MRRALISWTIAFAALLGAFGITVAVLNATLYSPTGFVGSYLDALARHDADTARALPGVLVPGDAPTDLLTDAALGSLTNITTAGDTEAAGGIHTVAFSYRIGDRDATSYFSVAKTGTFLGLFSQWKFQTSPLATVAVTVLHDSRFRANGVDVVSPATHGAAARYAVFAPGEYTFDHESTYLVAGSVAVPVDTPGSVTPVIVNVQANSAFVKAVSSELNSYLEKCATQKVLLPTACPFGKSFDNRVVDAPSWTMTRYPTVTIIPDGNSGNWLVPNTPSIAHIKVKVQSLYDGSVSVYDKDVPFDVSYSISVGADDQLKITSLYN